MKLNEVEGVQVESAVSPNLTLGSRKTSLWK